MDGQTQTLLFMILSIFKKSNNSETFDYSSIIITLIVVFFPIVYSILLKCSILKRIIQYINDSSSNEIVVKIPSHEIPIYRGLSTTPSIKNMYSKDFLAVIYYIMNYCTDDIKSITQIMSENKELSNFYSDSGDSEYIYIPLSNKRFVISKKLNIYCKLNINDLNDEDENNSKSNTKCIKKKSYILKLWMTHGNINTIRDFIAECNILYDKSKHTNDSNKRKIFVYDKSEKTEDDTKLYFKDYPMEHNKDLNLNIFFEGKDRLINYINPFVFDPNEEFNIGEEKYKRSGFTFKAGLLFYGYPGCGKTSTIKAILKYTNRHGIVLNLNRIKTCEELEQIFRKRNFDDKQLSGKELCYILEDCDATGESGLNILSSRKSKNTNNSLSKINYQNNDDTDDDEAQNDSNKTENIVAKLLMSSCEYKKVNDDSANLSCFLNILDGIIELHGIMIIMTTNYPEKIDNALIRPGRFDFKYEFKRASRNIIREMLKFKYELTEDEMLKYDNILTIKDEVLSPAQVQSVSFQNDNIVQCINELILLAQNKNI
jgi:hypothetical protein